MKIEFYQKIAKAGATAYHQTLEVPRTLVPEKKNKKKKLKKLHMFLLKIANIKTMKNIPLHLEAMRYSIIKP